MVFLLLKISGRNFVVTKNEKDDGYKNFIVREFGLNYKENDSFVLGKESAFLIKDGKINPIECKVKVIKVLKNHVKSFVKLRRKRHKKMSGYVQIVAYLSVL